MQQLGDEKLLDYRHHLAQSLFKAGRMEEALEVCEKIKGAKMSTEMETQVTELKAAILYEKNEFQLAISTIKTLKDKEGVNQLQNIINEGCVYFKMEQHEKAISMFKDAAKMCGFNAELFYNIALCYYEMGIFSEAYFYLDTIIRRAYELYPKLKLVTADNPVFEKNDKPLAQQILRETAIVEALNLKASILYNQGDRAAAKEITT